METLTQTELRELPTDRLRIMYSDARMLELNDYAGDILNAWEHILTTSYPRRQDRK